MGEARGLLRALAKGAEVIWEPADKPRLRVPQGMGVSLQREMGDVREVLRRAISFKAQLSENGPVPFLVLPESDLSGDGCIFCGIQIPENKIRCPLCQAAAWIALELTPLPH